MDQSLDVEAACVTDLRDSRLNTYREMPNDISSHYNDEGENEENYYGRFAYELIQNADDAVGKVDDPENSQKARFELHTGDDPFLIVANTGLPVDEDDTRALTTIGDTMKRDADRKAHDTSADDTEIPTGRTDSLLPYTARLPDCIAYDPDRHAIECNSCGTHYDPDIDGLVDGVECCHSLEDVDRDDIPVCALNLKRSTEEISESSWSVQELLFMQAVWDAQQRRTHPLEYDLQQDSMIRLREYAGLDSSGVVDLIDAGLVSKDTTHPHLLYSVTADGRDAIGEHNREGIDHGAGKGDLGESSHHVMLVAFAEDLAHRFADDPESAVETVESYYELEDGHRLDVVGLDAEEEVVLTIEAERVNNDVAEAAVSDFDKMASCEPDDAVWVVTSQSDAVRIMKALHDPNDGESRIDRTYSHTTPTSDYKIDAPGMTDVYTVADVQALLEE